MWGARRPGMKHVAVTGGGGEGCLKTPCTGTTVGKVYMCLFVFVKKENLERLKDYVLYLDFYK